MSQRAIYIAGPMRGYPAWNFAAFEAAQSVVEQRFPGAKIANPALMDIERAELEDLALTRGWAAAGEHMMTETTEANFVESTLRAALGEDTAWISRWGTDIVMLPGWEASSGARAEKALAEALRLEVWYLYPDTGSLHTVDPASVLLDPWANERVDVLRRYAEELFKATGDGSKKRQSGEKPPWYRDGGHEGAIFSHITKWKRGEKVDPDSGAHPLVHAAWRCLAIACSENGNNPDAERDDGKDSVAVYVAEQEEPVAQWLVDLRAEAGNEDYEGCN